MEKNVTFFLTHDDKDHYYLMENLKIKNFYVSKYVKSKIDGNKDDPFVKFYKNKKLTIDADP